MSFFECSFLAVKEIGLHLAGRNRAYEHHSGFFIGKTVAPDLPNALQGRLNQFMGVSVAIGSLSARELLYCATSLN